MMWLLITFIAIWALSPGPVAVMTLHETRKNGLKAGVAVSGGATLTATLMVISGLLIHIAGFSAILNSDGMFIIERIGAFGIIFMGMYAGYKSLWKSSQESTSAEIQSSNKLSFVQGIMLMATYIPQALIFYNMIVPQSVEPESVITSIIALGTLKVVLIFGWHSAIAFTAVHTQNWVGSNHFGKVFELSTACLIMGLGINILV